MALQLESCRTGSLDPSPCDPSLLQASGEWQASPSLSPGQSVANCGSADLNLWGTIGKGHRGEAGTKKTNGLGVWAGGSQASGLHGTIHTGERGPCPDAASSKSDSRQSPSPGDASTQEAAPHLCPTPWKASSVGISQLCLTKPRLSSQPKMQAPGTDCKFPSWGANSSP